MKGQTLALVVAFGLGFGGWSLAESPAESAATNTNEISEIIPIKYALAADIATALSPDKSGEGGSWVKRALVTPNERQNLYAQMQALGPRKITWDERSNSLLVVASASDLVKIKAIIAKVDVVLPQLLVEGVILQFPRNKRKATADKAQLPSNFTALTNVAVLSMTRFTSNAAAKTNSAGGQLSYEATLAGDLDVLVTSLTTNTPQLKVLQRPRIQTSTGVPATMFAGSAPPPYYGGAAYSCGCPYYARSLDTGVTIEVTCLLTTDGFLLTDIQQKVDRLVGNVTIQNVGDVPVTESYTTQAHVAVRDRQVIVLGGMVRTAKEPLLAEVPALDKVPIAGHLLNRIITSPTHTKTYELMVLIRPTLLPTPETPTAVASRDKMPSIRLLETELRAEALKRRAAGRDQGVGSH